MSTALDPTRGWSCPNCQQLCWVGISHVCSTSGVVLPRRELTDKEMVAHVSQQYSAYRHEMCAHVKELGEEIDRLRTVLEKVRWQVNGCCIGSCSFAINVIDTALKEKT